jgi:hypothetical protein
MGPSVSRAQVNSAWWRSWGYSWGYSFGSLGTNGPDTADPVVVRGHDGRFIAPGESRPFMVPGESRPFIAPGETRPFMVSNTRDFTIERHDRQRIVT